MTYGSGDLASNRQQLEVMIADISTGVLTVDTDGTLQYANRTALMMHGVDSLEALGGSAEGYRKTFVLQDLQGVPLSPTAYPLDRLLAGDTFTDLLVQVPVRNEMVVHKCRGISVRDDKGDVDFCALFLDDETERYDAEQRFERTFNANPGAALINRLSDLRFIKVNPAFLEMTGFRREQIIGRTAYQFDVLSGTDDRDLVLERFHKNKVIPPMESYIGTQSGGEKFVLVGGQPLEVGNEPCMLLTFIDLDVRKRAEDALRQSEERFARAFELAPVAGVISSMEDGRIFNTNQVFERLTGYPPSEAIGRTTAELGLWKSEGERIIAGLLKSSRGYQDLELKLHTKAGNVCDVLVSAATLVVGGAPCVLWMCLDVTEWKRSETEIVEAVDLVLRGSDWLGKSITKRLMAVRGRKPSPQAAAKLGLLSARERQVLELVCEGASSSEIAERLSVAPNTVRNYFARLYRKLGVHSKTELILWVKRHEVAA